MLAARVAAGQCRRSSRRVPEVTFAARAIESRVRLGYTGHMVTYSPARIRALQPLFLAAYATWIAVAIGAWREAAAWPALGELPGLGSVPARAVATLAMLGFLAAFVARGLLPERAPGARPDTSLWLMAASALALLLAGPSGVTPVLLIVLSSVCATSLTSRAAWFAIGALNAAFLAILLLRWQARSWPQLFLVYGGFQLFAALSSGALRRAETMAAQLRAVNAELLATRSLLAETARDGERLRVSRELHDVAGHKLTALKLNLEVLGHDAALAARREFGVVRGLATELLDDVRSVVSSLRRDDGLDLREALARVAEPFPRPRVHLALDAQARASDAARAETLLRVAQEALTNAARHSRADNVWLTLAARDGALELVVEDDGDFVGDYACGHGLTGMRERVQESGGTLALGRGPRGGFRVAARVPQARAA